MSLCKFSEAQKLVFWFFTNLWALKCASSLNTRYSKVAEHCSKVVRNHDRSHVSATCRLQWAPYHLNFVRIHQIPSHYARVKVLFWYRVAGNIVPQVFSKSEEALRLHEQCPAYVLTCDFLPHLSSCHRHYEMADCNSCWCLSPVQFPPK